MSARVLTEPDAAHRVDAADVEVAADLARQAPPLAHRAEFPVGRAAEEELVLDLYLPIEG